MIQISLNDSFYTITKDNQALKDAFIEMGFKPMANMQTYQTVGRAISLKKAIAHIKMTQEEVIEYLTKKGIEVTFYE